MKIILLISLLVFTLFADDDNEKSHHHYYSKDLTYLHLTKEQKKSLKNILKEYRHDVKKYRKYKKEVLELKQEMFSNDTFDTNTFKLLNEKVAIKASIIETALLEKIHTILTKEQREKFIDFIDEWEIE